MDEGKWITINGAHVFLKDGQSPMDAFIRSKGKEDDYARYDKNKGEFEKLFNKDSGTARTEFYKKLGLNGKPKTVNEEEFNNIVDEKNPIMQRSTSEKGYEDLVRGEYTISGLTNSMYGSGIYFAYGEEDKSYYAGLSNTEKVFEARMDKTANMIDSRDLDKIKDDIRNKLGVNKEKIDNIILADNGVLAGMLGYDGVYFDNVKYGLILNRGKLIVKE